MRASIEALILNINHQPKEDSMVIIDILSLTIVTLTFIVTTVLFVRSIKTTLSNRKPRIKWRNIK